MLRFGGRSVPVLGVEQGQRVCPPWLCQAWQWARLCWPHPQLSSQHGGGGREGQPVPSLRAGNPLTCTELAASSPGDPVGPARLWLRALSKVLTIAKFFFFLIQVQKPKITNVLSKAMTTKQRIKPTEMLSFRNYSHFIRLCLYWGDRAKPTDSSAMWPEKLNCISKAALRCRATLFVFVKIPHCYSFPSLSASLLIGPSACPTGNLAYVAKLLAAIWVKYSLSNALDMWGELLLCSSFFRNLTKSSYCVSYFFLLLRTLYFISSYSETVAGGWPTLVLWKRENNAKRGCPWRKMMPCSSCSHMQDRFFFQGQQPVRNMTAVLPLETHLFSLQSLETWLSLLQG